MGDGRLQPSPPSNDRVFSGNEEVLTHHRSAAGRVDLSSWTKCSLKHLPRCHHPSHQSQSGWLQHEFTLQGPASCKLTNVSLLVYGTFLIRLCCRLVYYRGTLEGKVPKLKLISVVTKFCCRSLWLSNSELVWHAQASAESWQWNSVISRAKLQWVHFDRVLIVCSVSYWIQALHTWCIIVQMEIFILSYALCFAYGTKVLWMYVGNARVLPLLGKWTLEQGANLQLHRKEHIPTLRSSGILPSPVTTLSHPSGHR